MRRDESSSAVPVNFVRSSEPVSGAGSRRGPKRETPADRPSERRGDLTITIGSGKRQVTISVSDDDPDPVARWHVDANGKIVWGNVHEKILGVEWPSREVPWQFVHPDDRRRVQLEWEQILSKRAPRFKLRFRVLQANGEYVEVIHQGKAFFCDGEFCGYKGTMEKVRA